MLKGLDIRDMLIIDRLELDLQPGLNVLTGETGAGKSILLDCLGFVLGWRGRADLVRSGAKQGEVTAWFDLAEDHPARAVLAEAGLPVRDELILRRVNTAEGRKTAWVNEVRASGDVLRTLSASLVELHGQQDDRGLLAASGHKALLDGFGNLRERVAEVRVRWRERQSAKAALSAAQARAQELADEEKFLRHSVTELEALAPVPGEIAELEEERRLMKAARGLGETIAAARTAVGEDGAGRFVRDAVRGLESAADRAEGKLDAALDALEGAVEALSEAEREVEAAAVELHFDPDRLERVEDRYHAYRALSRKHQVTQDDLAELLQKMAADLEVLEASATDIFELEVSVKRAIAAYETASEQLTAERTRAAGQLDTAMARELSPLKLERAAFATCISDAEPGPDGVDNVEFTVATNPGAPAGPLGRIASGGELSRFLLALKVCLHGGDTGRTLIFDEIDRGVGGATADAVGKRLAQLAETSQVLVVTHSPQVAARGGHHWRVDKRVENGATLSTVEPLDQGARIGEIARMLAGDTVTDEAKAAARALLSTAAN